MCLCTKFEVIWTNKKRVMGQRSRRIFLRMSETGRSYTQNFSKVQYIIIQTILGRKSMKKIIVPMEEYSVSFDRER